MSCRERRLWAGLTRRANHCHLGTTEKSKSPAPDAGSGLFREFQRSGVLSAAAFSLSLGRSICGGLAMRIFLVGALIASSLISFEARAQERAADAALGAVSGAVVLGPVGAVAGAIVGFAAGPSIARSWGMRGPPSAPRAQRTSQSSAASEPQSTGPAAPPLPAPRPAQPSVSPPPASPPGQPQASIAPQASSKIPPVQSLE